MSEKLRRQVRVNQATAAFDDDAPRLGRNLERMHEDAHAHTKQDPSPVGGLGTAPAGDCIPTAVTALAPRDTFVPALALSGGSHLCGVLIEHPAP